MDKVLLGVWPEAGSALGVGRSTLYELIASGQLRTVKIGRRRLVPVSAVHELVERLEQQSKQPAA